LDSASEPHTPVDRPINDRLGDVVGLELVGAFEFGDGSGDAQDLVVGAVSSCINPAPWWGTFGTLVIAPLLGCVFVLAKLVGATRFDKKNLPAKV
jgi:hypothetical protein